MERHGNLQSTSMISFYKQRFENVLRCEQLSSRPIGAISRKLVSDYMAVRKSQDGVSNATVNRELTILKTMLNKAVEWEFIEKNPIEKLKSLPEAQKRNVYLSMEDAQALLSELSDSFSPVVEYAIYTGHRLNNILGLSIEDVSFHDIGNTGEVRLKIKGGKWESYPVSPNAVKVLQQAIGARKSGFVFINSRTGKRYHSVTQSFRRAVRKLNLQVGDSYLRFHDLKHVFATWLHERGVPLDTIRVLCQHTKRSTTDRYTTVNTSGAAKVLSVIPKISTNRSSKSA